MRREEGSIHTCRFESIQGGPRYGPLRPQIGEGGGAHELPGSPTFSRGKMALNRYLTGVAESGQKETTKVASRKAESGKSGILETVLRFD